MNYRLLLQSIVFVLEGLLLIFLLSAAVHSELARLLFAIAVAVLCALGEIYVIVKVAQRLWKWSGRFTTLLIRKTPTTAISAGATTGTRGEA
jgi:hypothetical protein